MPHSPRRIFAFILPLSLACGPQAPAPADTATSSGTTAPAPEPTSDDPDPPGPTSSGPPPETTTTTTTTTDSTGQTSSTSSSTGDDLDTSSADTGGTSTTSPDPSGGDAAPCGPYCEPTRETCPPAAQVNASVTGATPLGPFAATFAAQSLPSVSGEHYYMVLVPSYSDADLCEQRPQLRLTLPNTCMWDSDPELAVPADLFDGQDLVATTTALLHNYDCTWWGFICVACEGHVAFDLEILDDGWSLGGSVAAGCCRAYYDNNSP